MPSSLDIWIVRLEIFTLRTNFPNKNENQHGLACLVLSHWLIFLAVRDKVIVIEEFLV